ncbi:MAG: hypothetical protein VW683_16725, partial [Betaproteobacteria bacterium]
MAKYILQIPANYAGRVGGNRQVSIEASSPSEAKTKVVEAGIPAAVLGTPVEIKGKVTSGSLPPDVSQYALPTSGPEQSAVMRPDRIVGANNPTLYSRFLAGDAVGGELVSGTPFAPNINPLPTMAEVQAAQPYTVGSPGDPFYQPPSYQPMTTADFAQITADQDAAERARIEQELLNLDAAEIANIEAAVRRQLADRRANELINASAVSNFSNEESSIAGGLFRPQDITPRESITPPIDTTSPTSAGSTGNVEDLMRLDELESDMFARLARGLPVPKTLTDEITRLRTGTVTGNGTVIEDKEDPEKKAEDLNDPNKKGVGGFNFEVKPPKGYVPPISISSLGSDPSLQGLLNFFLSNPTDYINEIPIYQDVYNEDGVVVDREQIGTEQVLSPLAEAALQTYSTQLGAASQDLASRFGTATPFGAIAGLDGTVDQAIALANLQARAGITNPYAALGTGSEIADIGTILRGGLTVDEQLALEGLRARGGLSAEQRLAELGVQYNPFSETAADRLALARAQASGGLTEESNILAAQQAAAANNPFAAAQLGIDIGNISTILRGGLTPEQQLALAQAPGNPFGLSAQQQIDLQNQLARGGLTAEEQRNLVGLQARGGLTAQEQRDLVGLQARGGLTVQEQLNLAGLQARGGLTAQERLAEQRLAALSPLLQASPGTLGGLSRVLG